MKIIKPNRLKKGDLLGIISPASSPEDLLRIDYGVSYLEKLGYRVEVGKHVGKYNGYLAGTDEERLEDLHYMFNKKEVKGIFCVRGGYGSPRLLNKIDFKIIKQNPKVFVGYSDITALQLAFFQKANLLTFAGPMIAVDFYNSVSEFTEEMFWSLVTSNKKPGRIKFPNEEKIYQITKGNTQGIIVGGNLALITSLVGTEYFPDMKNKILFLEDIAEMPYRIDRMLNQLALAKVFDKINGVILGAFIDCNESDPNKRTLTLGEVIEHYFNKVRYPVIYNFQHGHLKDNITIPFGIKIKLNASRGIIEFIESSVT